MHADLDKETNKTSFAKRTYMLGVPQRKTCSPQELEFALHIACGFDMMTSLKKAFPRANTPLYVRTRAQALLKTERVQAVIRQEVQDAAKKLGLDEEYVLKGLKDLFENGDSSKVKLGALHEIKDCLDMSPDKTPKAVIGRFGFRQDPQVAISDAEYEVLDGHKPSKRLEKGVKDGQISK